MDGYLTKPLKKANISEALSGKLGDDPATCDLTPSYDDPILDREHLKMLAHETSEETVVAIAESFISEMKDRENDLTSAQEARSLEDLKRCVHAIAGASASVGAERVRHIAMDVELACCRNADDEALALSKAIGGALSETYTELMEAFSAMRSVGDLPQGVDRNSYHASFEV
jgi:HPt (histidine-containing phosphotransfer) domain-containing protein